MLVKTNQVVQKTTVDIGQRFHFNTALAAIMELNNDIGAARAAGLGAAASGRAVLAHALEMMVRLLEPFAPHMGAELWEMMGHESIWDAPWPEADPRFLSAETVELAVQVNGKVRDRVEVAKDAAGRRTSWRRRKPCREWPSTWKARKWSRRWSSPAAW